MGFAGQRRGERLQVDEIAAVRITRPIGLVELAKFLIQILAVVRFVLWAGGGLSTVGNIG